MNEQNKRMAISRHHRSIPYLIITTISFLVVLDLFSKLIVRSILTPGDSVSLIGNLLRITYIQNTSGFSWWVPELPFWAKHILQGILVIIVIMAVPVYIFNIQTRKRSIWTDIAFVGIISGCLGHLLGDLGQPFTTDFIQILGSPCSNFSDLYAYTGIFALFVEMMRREKICRKNHDGRNVIKRMASTRKDFLNFLIDWLRWRRDT